MTAASSPAKWIVLGCVGLLFTCACGLAAAAFGVVKLTEAPTRAAKGFFADVRARNHPQALQRMSPEYQATHSLTDFTAALDALPALASHVDDTLLSRNVDNDSATLSGSLDGPGGTTAVRIELTKQGEYWYVARVFVADVPLR